MTRNENENLVDLDQVSATITSYFVRLTKHLILNEIVLKVKQLKVRFG